VVWGPSGLIITASQKILTPMTVPPPVMVLTQEQVHSPLLLLLLLVVVRRREQDVEVPGSGGCQCQSVFNRPQCPVFGGSKLLKLLVPLLKLANLLLQTHNL